MINLDLLAWFGNVINFLIFAYLFINIINTNCFDVFQLGFALVGLLISIIIQIISMIIKFNLKQDVN